MRSVQHEESHSRTSVANVKITGIMQKSNEVARSMAQLMRVGEFQAVSAQFSKELIKVGGAIRGFPSQRSFDLDCIQMGIMGEMMNEAVDAAMDNNDLEDETDEEIAKVLNEVLTGKTMRARGWGERVLALLGKLGQLPSVAAGRTAVGEREASGASALDVDSEEDEMEKRLQALRS